MTIYLRILQRRWPIIALAVIAAVLVSFVLAARQAPMYVAQTKLRVVPFGIGRPDYGTYLYFEQVTNTLIELLESDAVVKDALAQLEVETLPTYRASVLPRTELLAINVTALDAVTARDTANALANILVERMRSQYVDSVGGIEKTFYGRLRELETEINALSEEQSDLLNQVPRDEARLSEIGNLLTTRGDEYRLLLSSYNQVLIAQATQSNLVSIIEPAALPEEPVAQRLILTLIVAAVIGAGAGLVIAFAIELIQPRIHTRQQARYLTKSPIINELIIPPVKKGRQEWEIDDKAFEAVRRIRAQIIHATHNDQPRPLGIIGLDATTPSAMFAAQLARAFAELEQQTVLIDADHAVPTFSRFLGSPLQSKPNTTQQPIPEATPIPCLSLLTFAQSGRSPAVFGNPAAWEHLMTNLMETHERLIVYAPAVVDRADTLTFAMQIGQVILIVPRGAVQQKVASAVEELGRLETEIIQVVLV